MKTAKEPISAPESVEPMPTNPYGEAMLPTENCPCGLGSDCADRGEGDSDCPAATDSTSQEPISSPRKFNIGDRVQYNYIEGALGTIVGHCPTKIQHRYDVEFDGRTGREQIFETELCGVEEVTPADAEWRKGPINAAQKTVLLARGWSRASFEGMTCGEASDLIIKTDKEIDNEVRAGTNAEPPIEVEINRDCNCPACRLRRVFATSATELVESIDEKVLERMLSDIRNAPEIDPNKEIWDTVRHAIEETSGTYPHTSLNKVKGILEGLLLANGQKLNEKPR